MLKKTTIVLVKFQCFFISSGLGLAFLLQTCFYILIYICFCLAYVHLKCKQAGDVDRFIRQLVNRWNRPSVTQVKDILA